MNEALQINLKNGTPRELRTRLTLLGLMAKYDLSGWMFTPLVEVDETSWPHSHPVLTLDTQYADDQVMCLAALVHEQLHWFEEDHAEARDRAIADTYRCYPEVPSACPEGAGSESSTRLHLIVCYLEYQALKCLLGGEAARSVVTALSRHHYTWVYRTVLDDEDAVEQIVHRHDLLPEPLRPPRPTSVDREA